MRILSALMTTTWSPESRYGVKLGLSLPISMRATFVASRPSTTFVASTTNQFAPSFSASASAPLATYVLIATVTPFPVETNVNLKVPSPSCQRTSAPANGPSRSACLPPLRQNMEAFVPAKAINPKIRVQRKNIPGPKFIRHPNQTRIRKVDLPVAILSQDLSYAGRIPRNLKRYLKGSRLHVFDHRFPSAGKISQQKAALGNHRLARNQRRLQLPNHRGTLGVKLLAPVQQRHDRARIRQYRLH